MTPPPTDAELAALRARVARCTPATARTLRQQVQRATRMAVPCYPDPDAPGGNPGTPSLEGPGASTAKEAVDP